MPHRFHLPGQNGGLQLREPFTAVRREHRVGCAVIFQNFVFFKNDVVLKRIKRDIFRCQSSLSGGIAFQGVGFIIPVGIHRPDRVILEQLRPYLFRFSITNHQGTALFLQFVF